MSERASERARERERERERVCMWELFEKANFEQSKFVACEKVIMRFIEREILTESSSLTPNKNLALLTLHVHTVLSGDLLRNRIHGVRRQFAFCLLSPIDK